MPYRTFFIIICYLYHLNCNPFICAIKVWQLNGREIIVCSEEHSTGHYANEIQHKLLIKMLPVWAKEDLHIIVEDLMDYGGPCHVIASVIEDQNIDSPLSNLVPLCKKYSIAATNVEFRFARSAGVTPIVSFLDSQLGTAIEQIALFIPQGESSKRYIQTCLEFIDKGRVIESPIVVKEFDDAAKEVAHYDDGSYTCAYYKRQLTSLRTALPLLKKLSKFHGTVAQYIYNKVDLAKRRAITQDLVYFDVNLVDARTIHAIINSRQFSKNIVFLGKFHAFQVGKYLETLGAIPVKTLGSTIESSYPVCSFDGKTYHDPDKHVQHSSPILPLSPEQLSILASN